MIDYRHYVLNAAVRCCDAVRRPIEPGTHPFPPKLGLVWLVVPTGIVRGRQLRGPP
jgi:hypothetical protein